MANTSKRLLTHNDFQAVWEHVPEDKWPQAKLEMVWERCIPDDASINDLKFFLYSCHTRGLDPLLGEAYLRLQWDRERGIMKPVIIIGISGALKRAHESGAFSGIKTEFQENDAGLVISATTKIWRKDCPQPFEATNFYGEYVQTNKEGKPTHMWSSKPHIMLGKTSQMAALRLAFAAELGGVYVAEELGRDSSQENTEFVVRAKSEASESRPIEKEPPAPESTGGGEKSPAALRSKLLADKQRILLDLGIPKQKSKELLDQYFRGFLADGNDPAKVLPKEPERYVEALMMLDLLALTEHDITRSTLEHDPIALGLSAQGGYAEWFYRAESYVWDSGTCSVAYRLAHLFQFEEFSELEDYLKANKVNLNQPDDCLAFMRFALMGRDLAMSAAARAEQDEIGVAFVLDAIEETLGGKIEAFTAKAVQELLNQKEKSHGQGK